MSLSYNPRNVVMDHGEGMYLVDREGNRYLDFVAGIAVNALGYQHPKLTAAIQEQASKVLHVSNIFWSEPQILLQEKLAEVSFGDRAYLCNSGAEANEAAIKMARRYQSVVKESPRFEFITFEKSFHGRTMGAISATGQPKYHKGFEPLVPGFLYAKYNDLDSVRACVSEHTAAIMVEPIQGEGGLIPATREFLQGLRDICDEIGALLIFDEVQCGVGRTGDWFAYQGYGIEPDIMSLAKGLGGGVPIGATIAKNEVARAFQPGSHATTFGGNPLATCAANAVLTAIEEEQLLQRVTETGALMASKASALIAKYDGLVAFRGRGLMCGIEVDVDKLTPSDIETAAREEGLLINIAGGKVLRFVPPLITEAKHVEEAYVRLDRALAKVMSQA